MKFIPPLSLVLLGVCLIGATPSVPAPQRGADPTLSPQAHQRMAAAALDGSLTSWQRGLIAGIAREDAPGRAHPWHAATSTADGTWIPESVEPTPSARVEPTAIYDPARDRMVVFGGAVGGDYLDEVWELSLSGKPAWTKLAPTGIAPSSRYAHTAIYDPVRDRMVVFGGVGDGGPVNDVWALSLAGDPVWSELNPGGTSPSPRVEHSAIYDPIRDRMVVFGGVSDAGFVNEVWELSLAGTPEWLQLSPAGMPPSERYAHSAVYDSLRDRMLVFGGYTGVDNLNDTWELSLAGSPAWTQLTPSGGVPSPRVAHRAVYDPVRDAMLVFGGRVFNLDFNNEVWELSLTGNPAWSSTTPSGASPSARAGHAAIYDPLRDHLVVFGGLSDAGLVRDSWTLSLDISEWTPLEPGRPSDRYVHTAIYDRVRDRMVVFGGVDGDWVNDIWTMSLSTSPSWSHIIPGGTPPDPRGAHTAIYDAIRDRMVIFGGANITGYLNDTWVLSLSGDRAWTQLTPAGAPPPRNWHTAIYDPVRDRMVVFGGVYFDGVQEHFFNDVWALSLGGNPTWTQLLATGTPPDVRSEHTAIYDPVRDRMVIFGGFMHNGTNHRFGDVWALSLSSSPAWTELTPTGAQPSPRAAQTAIYDPVRDRMVIFGGHDGSFLNDSWALSLTGNPAWSQLSPGGSPPGVRARSTAVYDRYRDRMVVFGGLDPNFYLGDVWTLQWDTPTGVFEQSAESAPKMAPAYPNPSRDDVSIGFTLPKLSQGTLRIYDVSGRLVRTLAEGTLTAGRHLLHWDRRLSSGVLAASGSYFYELSVNGEKLARRVVLVK